MKRSPVADGLGQALLENRILLTVDSKKSGSGQRFSWCAAANLE